VRALLLQFHRWTGLTVGLVLVFIAVTGLGMLFRPQLEPVVEKHLLEPADCSVRQSLDRLVSNARAAHSGQPIEEVEIARHPGRPVIVRFEDRHDIYVNSCDGSVIASRSHWGGFFGTVEQLHRFRFLDNWTGDVIGGTAAAVMLLVFVAGGITIWWPASRRALKNAFKVKWSHRGRAFELNLHRATGIYVCLILLVIGLSALPLAFKPVRYWIYAATRSPIPAAKPKSKPVGADSKPADLRDVVRRAHNLVPGARSTFVVPPHRAGDPVEIFMIADDAPHPNARSYAYFDAFSGALLRFEPYDASSPGHRIHRWLSSLHMGYLGGPLGQLALALGVLGVPLLAYTGIASYLHGRKARSARPAEGRS